MSYHFLYSLIERACPFCTHRQDEFQQQGLFQCKNCLIDLYWNGSARFATYKEISFVYRHEANQIDVFLKMTQQEPSFCIKGAALSMQDIKRAEKLTLL